VFKYYYVAFPTLLLIIGLSSCQRNSLEQKKSLSNGGGESTLTLTANGEDFIRQGFVSKDGWRIDFNHAYITLNQVVAYQTDPPFDPESKEELEAKTSVTLLDKPTTVDLALGDENAQPVEVNKLSVPVGIYNSIGWQIVNNPENNGSIVLDGIASKDDRTINFVLKFSLDLNYLCGEFVGEERKGIVKENEVAQLETTFHFDHLFGDISIPKDDELNVNSLGFSPLVAAANNGKLNADLTMLQQKLSPEEYNSLIKNIESLGHVGEGHCRLISKNTP
jgi:hypothetical protein